MCNEELETCGYVCGPIRLDPVVLLHQALRCLESCAVSTSRVRDGRLGNVGFQSGLLLFVDLKDGERVSGIPLAER